MACAMGMKLDFFLYNFMVYYPKWLDIGINNWSRSIRTASRVLPDLHDLITVFLIGYYAMQQTHNLNYACEWTGAVSILEFPLIYKWIAVILTLESIMAVLSSWRKSQSLAWRYLYWHGPWSLFPPFFVCESMISFPPSLSDKLHHLYFISTSTDTCLE